MSPSGGKRKGAGRKPIVARPQSINLYLDEASVSRLDRLRGQRSRSAYIRAEIIERK